MAGRRRRESETERALREAQQSIENVSDALTGLFAPGKRKPWEQLSPGYRRRLERRGITEEQHRRGEPLHRARGHISREHETFRRKVRAFAGKQEQYYGRDATEVEEFLLGMPEDEVSNLIDEQTRAEKRYLAGDGGSPQFWAQRDTRYPDWMHYYHGVFS